MLIVGELEYHFNKGIKTFPALALKIGAGMESEFVDAGIVTAILLQKTADPAVLIRDLFFQQHPVFVFILFGKADGNIGSGPAGSNIQDMTGELIALLLGTGAKRKTEEEKGNTKPILHDSGFIVERNNHGHESTRSSESCQRLPSNSEAG